MWNRRLMHGGLLAFAAALAVPAYLLTHESFQPIEQRVHLQGNEVTWSFELVSPEPLFLEFEFTIHAPDAENAGIVLRVNDTEVAAIKAEQLYVTQRAMPLVPLNAVRTGENRLQVRVDGPEAATFEMNLRLHNYYGINSRFPRAFVVSDEAVSHFFQQLSMSRRVLRFSTFYLLSLLAVYGIARVYGATFARVRPPGELRRAGWRARVSASAVLLSPSVLLWCTLVYAFTSPLHIWLSREALLAVGLVPLFLAACAMWISSHRLVVARVARVAVAAMVTLVVLEIGLRLINYISPTSIFYTDSYSRYRGRPGAPHLDARLNSLGFNDVDYEPSKPPGAYRIAAIGDSVAFGVVPYRANYLTLLEAELASEGRIEVINLGVPATEPKDYLAILLDEALAFQPDLVMLGFFIGNDFESAARKPHEHSFAATFLYFLWRVLGAGMPAVVHIDSSTGRYDDDEPSLAWERFLEIEVGRAEIYSKDEAAVRTPMARTVGYLRDMRNISQRAGANILVVFIPDEVQIDHELQAHVVRAHGSTREQFDFRLPNRLLAGELSKEGIPFLDLLPLFEQEGRHTRLYKPRDTHWNLAGNRLAATAIARFLREQVLRVSR